MLDDVGGTYDLRLGGAFYVEATDAPFDRPLSRMAKVTKGLFALVPAGLPADMKR